MLEELKQKVLEAALEAERSGLCKHKSGNFSALDRVGGRMAISPAGMRREDLTVEDVPILSLDGRILEAGARGGPSSEYRMHAEAYRLRADILSVVHTHSQYAAAFAVSGKPIRPVLFEAAFYGGCEIAVAAFARPGTEELAKSIRGPLASADVCLLKNHGLLAVGGADIGETLRKAAYAEDVARAYFLALTLGGGREPDAISAEAFEGYRRDRGVRA
ncbi:MAG: class II aldolase/adducin family protein [Clostridiales Family XIII bacterium]|jgi:L-fuculose-phosphate aldolase|nr:class II aldolase/adducin family protein [Clostridiales Family XIII bacterium]